MRIEQTFTLEPCSLSLQERIKRCGFSWVNKDIQQKNFKETDHVQQARTVKVVCFDETLGYELMRGVLRKNALSDGTIYDLLDLAYQHPEYKPASLLYALKDRIKLRYMGESIAHPCLRFSKKIKELSLPWYNGEWPAETLFLLQ